MISQKKKICELGKYRNLLKNSFGYFSFWVLKKSANSMTEVEFSRLYEYLMMVN